MLATRVLFSQAVRLTLFTRAGCGLCDTAKHNVSKFLAQKPLHYSEVDIMEPGNKAWKDVYEFDVPVLHVQTETKANSELSDPKKLFHRFTEQEVEEAVNEVSK
ncbi:hypothetical protein DTO169E5_3917 [Paecilomyces variotii]|nr:hypothetical protein DTO169E5_3917 [Paecilomyces variotii]